MAPRYPDVGLSFSTTSAMLFSTGEFLSVLRPVRPLWLPPLGAPLFQRPAKRSHMSAATTDRPPNGGRYSTVTNFPQGCFTGEMELLAKTGVPAAYSILRNRCREHLQTLYDFTLIDCPPNLGFFVLSALYCADFVIVPVIAGSAFSLEGLTKAAKIIGQISSGPNPDLRFLHMLVNNVDMRTHFGKTCMSQLRSQFGNEQVFNTYIPASAAFQHAEAMRRTLIRHASNSNASKGYRDLAQDLTMILEAEA